MLPREEETCKCCGGRGVQVDKNGITIRCPECGGTGKWNVPKTKWG